MHNLYLPVVSGSATVSMTDRLFSCIANAPWQQRFSKTRNPQLDAAAQARAVDLATRDYFSHETPEGMTPNENLRNFSFRLPEWYLEKGNNVESIAGGQTSPEAAVQAWLNSPAHHAHVAGFPNFYDKQDCMGVGYIFVENSKYKQYWVFVSAPCDWKKG